MTFERATSAALALAVVSVASSSRADPPSVTGAEPDLLGIGTHHDRVTVRERIVFGVATSPFEARSLFQAKGQMLAFVTDGWVRIAEHGWLGLRVPVVAGSVAQPAGSYVDEAAWGNPELRAALSGVLVDHDGLVLRWTAGAGVAAPLAEHASSLLPNRTLAIANGVEGFAEPELFRPGRLPLTPFGQLDVVSGRWRALGLLKVPLLFRVGDADIPRSEAEPRAAAIAVVARIEGRVSITRAFGFALATQLFVDALPAAVPVLETPRAQLLFRAGPFFQIADWGSIAVEVQAPAGGALGGSTLGGGLRFAVSL